jgi:hypothetical protein
MVTLLPVERIVPVSVPLSVPPPVALLRVIVVVLVGLDGLPLASCDCTVTLNAVPAVPVLGTVVYTSFVAAPAFTVNAALVPVLLDAVDVIVNEPVFVMVTLCGSSTPPVKLPEVTGLPVRAPVEVNDAVEVNDVTVLLFTS